MILAAVSMMILSLVSCENEEEEQTNDNPIVYVLSAKDSDTGDKGSHMPPDD